MTNLESIAELLFSIDEDNREIGRLLIDSQNIDEADLVQPMCKVAFNSFIQQYNSWVECGKFREIVIQDRWLSLKFGASRDNNYIIMQDDSSGHLGEFSVSGLFDKNHKLIKPRELYRGIYLFFSKRMYSY